MARAVAHEFVDDLRFETGFGAARPRRAHGADVRAGGDLSRAAHQLQFVSGLVQPQIVQQMRQHQELAGRHRAVHLFAADRLHPAEDVAIEFGMFAEIRVHLFATLKQAGQDVAEIADGETVVHAEHLRCAVGPHPFAGPLFEPGFALFAEQNHLAVLAAWCEYQHGVGLFEAGQVIEVAALTEQVFGVAVADQQFRRRQHGDGARRHQLHQLLPSALILILTHRRPALLPRRGSYRGSAAPQP